MSRLSKRVDALEAGKPDLSPRLKAWLGWDLSEEEQQALDANAGVEPDFSAIDMSGCSPELKRWLGID